MKSAKKAGKTAAKKDTTGSAKKSSPAKKVSKKTVEKSPKADKKLKGELSEDEMDMPLDDDFKGFDEFYADGDEDEDEEF